MYECMSAGGEAALADLTVGGALSLEILEDDVLVRMVFILSWGRHWSGELGELEVRRWKKKQILDSGVGRFKKYWM